MGSLIEIANLSFQRGQRIIFDNISLSIPTGKITAIMGPSGTGKTTLLRLIGRQLRPQKGSITIQGHNLAQLNRTQLYQLRKKMGMLFQSGALFTHLNVFENVAFPLREHTKLPETMLRDLVLLKLEMVGLRGARDLMPSELSGGMARRVALARAIALDPELVMYDEPLAGQDPITIGVLVKLIRELNDTLGISSIIVSHDVNEILSIADYVYVLADGKIIAQGSPTDLKEHATLQLTQFLQGLPDGPVPFHYPAQPLAQDLLVEISE